MLWLSLSMTSYTLHCHAEFGSISASIVSPKASMEFYNKRYYINFKIPVSLVEVITNVLCTLPTESNTDNLFFKKY